MRQHVCSGREEQVADSERVSYSHPIQRLQPLDCTNVCSYVVRSARQEGESYALGTAPLIVRALIGSILAVDCCHWSQLQRACQGAEQRGSEGTHHLLEAHDELPSFRGQHGDP